MGEIDQLYLETHFYGSKRRMSDWNRRRNEVIRNRVRRLMRTARLRDIYRLPAKAAKQYRRCC